MKTLRPWIIMSWIMLPGAMVGGGLLLRRLTFGDVTPFQATWIRAFHAHGGVLILMSILSVASCRACAAHAGFPLKIVAVSTKRNGLPQGSRM